MKWCNFVKLNKLNLIYVSNVYLVLLILQESLISQSFSDQPNHKELECTKQA